MTTIAEIAPDVYTLLTEPLLGASPPLQPATRATMHGSTFTGSGECVLSALALVSKHVVGASASR